MKHETKQYEAPKPFKRRTSIKDRILKNPYTSIAGLICLGFGMWVLKMDLDESTKFTVASILFGCAALGLGLKEKS